MNIIKLEDVSIQFPGVKALDKVSFNIKKGQMLALCGENGAGKSTLGKIIAGVYPHHQFQGKIMFKDSPMKFLSTLDAEKVGIAIVHQELNLFNELTVAENIFINDLPRKKGYVDFVTLNKNAAKILEQIGLPINPETKVSELTVSTRQMIEIAKVLSKNPEVIIFDEATSSLSNHEVSILFDIINRLKKQGITMIYVSHKLNEIFEICDSVAILKDGNFMRMADIKDTTKDDIITWMVGREVKDLYPAKDKRTRQDIYLQVKNWSVFESQDRSKKMVDNISFNLKKGEILGIYGLVGSGRTELVNSIFEGNDANSIGNLFIEGNQIKIKNPAHAIQLGFALITEDRKKSGLFFALNVKDNMAIASLNRTSNKAGIINESENDKRIERTVNRLRVKVPNVTHLVKNLSGGNQQKVILGKWLLTNPSVLILDEPTRGIDVGAKADIYKIIQELSNKGVSIIIVSSELPEIIGVSDRILVMKEGKIEADVLRENADEELLVRYAMGGALSGT